ncbi:aspartyl-tRNA(Asn)/glutamyl-tRNA(Gln) amidotransferase subunit A [Enhydrobacter aerosaccus]|uniref:Aspartyl-tRNA(Asn)/glutamyl-tRNA(Gln) amidotransferase subunit A n=1 Tax=Enhydrobacter aerosaccus TaxID=225324 RepID=A0A1T4R8K3_9HYPH|nr:amidase family protein [Enhydrobacter aerosaccus]SKA11941.1 aspartyl-tRNA(Asn)/glutamyl-tRNA(Gln) amidotransferase subunit A [Enhydrobacter aerosaccus]
MPVQIQSARLAPASESLARLSARDLLDGYGAGRFTPRDVIDEVIAALQAIDRLCNVVVTDMYESARAEADRATAAWRSGGARGALAGVPVTIKDLIYVAGVPAKGGAPMNAAFVPEVDAAVVSALRAAGAILTCKTTTCESGYKLTADSPVSGITRNPWHRDRTSGGSSGGAAAAVAAACGPLAVGTDGVGSIRVPSSFCGVFGLKPTFGLVPRSPGFFPPSWASLAHTGPIARTVGDAALLLGVIAAPDARDPGNVPVAAGPFAPDPALPRGLKIAFSPDLGFAPVQPGVRAAFERAVETLRGLGAAMVEDHPGLDPDILETVLKPIAFSEQAGAVAHCPPSALRESEADYLEVVAQGRRYSAVDYVAASHRRAQLRGRFLDLFRRADVLVTPTVATTAFAAGTIGVSEIDGRAVDPHLGWSPFTWPINLAGLPAATIPCGFDRDGLPVGLQIVVPWFKENLLLSVAAAFERAAPWAATWPTLSV